MFHVEHKAEKDVPRGTNHVTITNCPICQSGSLKEITQAIDYTVTRESFRIQSCQQCHFLLTNPQPAPESLAAYYASQDYISHSETKKGLINRLYHIAQKKNLKDKFKACKKRAPHGPWADYGSGAGAFVKYATDQGQNIIGFEPSDDARKAAKIKGIASSPIEHFPNDKSYSCITMWHVLEHIPDFQEVLTLLVSHLVSKGILVIAVPNHQSYDSAFYKSYWAALDVPRHLWHFTEKDVRSLASKLNMSVEKVLPMPFDSYYVSMLSEKYKNGSMIRGIMTGLISNFIARFSSRPYSSQIYILRK